MQGGHHTIRFECPHCSRMTTVTSTIYTGLKPREYNFASVPLELGEPLEGSYHKCEHCTREFAVRLIIPGGQRLGLTVANLPMNAFKGVNT